MQLLTKCLAIGLDSGRGGAELWSLVALDREEHRQMTAEVTVKDAGGLVATHPVTVVVDDINDNPMRPGAKVVHLWKIQVCWLLYLIFFFYYHYSVPTKIRDLIALSIYNSLSLSRLDYGRVVKALGAKPRVYELHVRTPLC